MKNNLTGSKSKNNFVASRKFMPEAAKKIRMSEEYVVRKPQPRPNPFTIMNHQRTRKLSFQTPVMRDIKAL